MFGGGAADRFLTCHPTARHYPHPMLPLASLRIGHAHSSTARTGTTVLVLGSAHPCAVDVRGGAPGTREVPALSLGGLISSADAITLSGGSVYGLAAADEVTAWLGARGQGYHIHSDAPRSPVVGGAILFDNLNGGSKAWGEDPPFRRLAQQALGKLSRDVTEGAVGAGYGATAGTHAGGLGYASEAVGPHTVASLVAANPVGSPFLPGTAKRGQGVPWAWPWEVDGEFGGRRPAPDWQLSPATDTKLGHLSGAGAATVIGVVMTDAELTQGQLQRLAVSAHDGIAMSVQPSHTPLDGDTLFALGARPGEGAGPLPEPAPRALARLGAAAARTTARALTRGVLEGISHWS